MREHYETIVLGAGYYGLGYASTHPDCLILEESQMVGGDFHSCLHPVHTEQVPENEMTDIMREYGIWNGETFDFLKAQTVVHEYVSRKLEAGLDILLDCRILAVKREAACVRVEFITNQGVSSVTAENLVDTTSDCISNESAVSCKAKTLNGFTVAMTEDFSDKLRKDCPECVVLNGPLENEKLICFPVKPQESLPEAYRKIITTWEKAFPDGEEKILFIAETFDAVYTAEQKPDGWVGRRFANPMEAFGEGAMAQ